MSTQFSSICPINRNLSGKITPDQSRLGSDDNGGVLWITSVLIQDERKNIKLIKTWSEKITLQSLRIWDRKNVKVETEKIYELSKNILAHSINEVSDLIYGGSVKTFAVLLVKWTELRKLDRKWGLKEK